MRKINGFTVYGPEDPNALDEYSEQLAGELGEKFNEQNQQIGQKASNQALNEVLMELMSAEGDIQRLDGRVETNEESIVDILTAMNGVFSTLTNQVGRRIELELNSSTFVLTAALKNSLGNVLNSVSVDLPLETMIVNGSYNSTTKKVVLTLQNGNTVEFSIADLIDGLVNQSTFNALESRVSNTETELNNAKQSTNKGKSFSSVDARIEELEDDVDTISKNKGHIYTIRRKISSNTSPTWERLDDAIGLVANATKNGGTVQNNFDNLSPWKDIISFNLDLETGKKKAYYGDVDFAFDGSNGDVYTHIPTFWLKLWQENDYMYISIADYNKVGYTEVREFDIARYLLGIGEDTKPHSYSGLAGADFRNIVTYRNLVKNSLGNNYCLMDWRYFVIQCLFLVEYATFNSQSALGNGMQSMRHNRDDKALIAETNTSRIIINTTAGNAFVVGQQVKIGGYESSSAVLRTITAINDYDDGTITGKEIILDEEIANITLTTTIWSCVQSAGQCDALGMKSGCITNDNKHNVIYRGIENFFGNIYQFVDGINIKDRVAWVCYEPDEYVSDKFEAPYEELGYTNADTSGYPKVLGFDTNHPLIQFPTELGGSTSTGTCDYYYQDAGNRVARVGGSLYNGAGCGAWCWFLNGTSSLALWNCGARVLKHQ